MDFALNEEQLELQEMVREFVEKEITPYAAEMDAENHMRDGLIDKANEMGLLNVIVPEELDGPGLDSISVATIYEELGKGCAGVATSLAANSLATVPVLLAGTDEQKKMYCDILNNGGLAAFALTEPGAGSDAGGVSTRAVHNKEEGTYTLNGTKMFITNGGLAEIFLVFANTRKTGGIRGLTAFIVPKDTPGFSVGKKENKMGIRPSNTTELVLQDVVIPESYRVGREGEGFRSSIAFSHSSFFGEFHALVTHPASLLNHEASSFNLHSHVSQHALNHLEGSNRLAELTALFSIFNSTIQSSLSDTYGNSANERTSAV